MKKTSAVLIAGLSALPWFILAPGRASKAQRAPFTGRNFAHRGLHSQDKTIPENSLKAFRLAAQAGYGVELDLRLSRDGHIVVFHDHSLERMCGVEGNVEDYDLCQLQQFSLLGTEQHIPLFSDVLKAIDGRGPIIIEIKDCPKRMELCRKLTKLLEDYQGPVCIESFDPFVVAWFRFHDRKMLRGQLAAPMETYDNLKAPLPFLLSNCLFNIIARPQFIAYKIGPKPFPVKLAHLMGAMKIAWTSHEARNEKANDGVIFEFYTPDVKYK